MTESILSVCHMFHLKFENVKGNCEINERIFVGRAWVG